MTPIKGYAVVFNGWLQSDLYENYDECEKSNYQNYKLIKHIQITEIGGNVEAEMKTVKVKIRSVDLQGLSGKDSYRCWVKNEGTERELEIYEEAALTYSLPKRGVTKEEIKAFLMDGTSDDAKEVYKACRILQSILDHGLADAPGNISRERLVDVMGKVTTCSPFEIEKVLKELGL